MVQCRLKPQVIGKKDESSNYSTLEEPEEQAQCKLEPARTCEHQLHSIVKDSYP